MAYFLRKTAANNNLAAVNIASRINFMRAGSAGKEHFFSVNFLPFISQDFADRGARLKVRAVGTDVSIYNYNFVFVRLHSNKG